MRVRLSHFFNQNWYQPRLSWPMFCLLPFSFLFRLLSALRYFAYHIGIFKSYRLSVPVIVVGNITVGGTGKTPLVIWLAEYLKQFGFKPGIASRGVEGNYRDPLHLLKAEDKAEQVGDEAVLMFKQTQLPVVVGKNRYQAARHLQDHCGCTVILLDDGLQHYRLQRDKEIVLVDTARQFGNQYCLPAGPLREPLSRLKTVDLVISHGSQQGMQLIAKQFVSLKNPDHCFAPVDFVYKKVHAVAAIGHPERFFKQLESLGLTVIAHSFPDHHLFSRKDIYFDDDLPVIMTAKDAVKCYEFADESHWLLETQTILAIDLQQQIRQWIDCL